MEKVALITGGFSGIGREVAKALPSDTRVVLADLPTNDAPELGDNWSAVLLDVSREDQWEAVAEHTAQLGRLDYLVLSAGIAPIVSVGETTADIAQKVLDVNVASIITGVRVLWDQLVASTASIVIVGSVAGLVGQNKASAYVASKGAVIALTRALAIEFAPHGVRVNCVAPGPTDTPMIRRHFGTLADPEGSRHGLERRMPLGRLLTPNEVAKPIVFLLSAETASGINGTTLVVDGGLTATFDYGGEFAGGDHVD